LSASMPILAAFARTQRIAAFVSWICAGHKALPRQAIVGGHVRVAETPERLARR
jgi:hypothetical protein